MAPAAGRTLVICAAMPVAIAAGCSLDFTVRPDPGDAGVADAGDVADAGPAEAGEDSGATDAPAGDAGADAAVDCEALANDMDAKRAVARQCTLASGHCTTTVKNQCGCDVVIAIADSAATFAYAEAVKRFNDAKCPFPCPTPCPSTANRNCLQQGADVLCYP